MIIPELGSSVPREGDLARGPDPQEGRGHAQLREQQPFRHPLHHLRRGLPQGRDQQGGQGENCRHYRSGVEDIGVQRARRVQSELVKRV